MKFMKMPDEHIYDWFERNYPEVRVQVRVGALNTIIRTYADEIGYDFFAEKSPRCVDAYDFFNAVLKKTDEELLSLYNFGQRKLNLIRDAQKRFIQESKDFIEENMLSAYKTRFNWITADWKRVKNHCRTTDNKGFTDKDATEEFKRMLLISEHSPIRLIEVDWSWEDIYSWVATHWSRHKFEKFISTQRDDRKEHDIPRGNMPQDTPVKFDGYANMQNLIDVFRKRLCYQASPETRALAEDFKMALHEIHPELADALVPNCVYRCGCPEFHCCGYIDRLVRWIVEHEEEDHIGGWLELCGGIQRRYDLYNQYFYETKEKEMEALCQSL